MKQILLVDDDARLLDALVRQFRPHRHEWQVATAGNEGDVITQKHFTQLGVLHC